MRRKRKILIFSYHQFGLLVDTLKYCQYSSNEFDITYLGWDYGEFRTELPDVTVKYVSREGSLFTRNVRLLKSLHKEISSGNYDVSFLHYTRGISAVKLFHWREKMVFDVRTMSVSTSWRKRISFNLFLKFESLFFRNRTVISEGVARQLKFRKYKLLPLGADVSHEIRRVPRKELNILYVGTLAGRDIIKCVKGVEEYISRSADPNIRLTIVGDGPELAEIEKYVRETPMLLTVVKCVGRIPHHRLREYFEWADIGVSYVPITPWYTFQPPTKTFEYLLAGLPVIATRTYENEMLLSNEPFCELIADDVEGFVGAIGRMKAKLKKGITDGYFQSKYKMHDWKRIVETHFVPAIEAAK